VLKMTPAIVGRLFPLILALLALIPLPAAAADSAHFFDSSLGDFKAELDGALKENKQGLLLMFEVEGCPFCRKMKEQVLSRDEVQAYYRKYFAIVAVDVLGSLTISDFAGQSMTEKSFARAMKVRGTPTFLFIGPDGKEMARYVGATRDTREFMELGRFVVEGHWRTQEFRQFYPRTQPESRKP